MIISFELVIIPVSDVGQAKQFYEQLGWNCDIDHIAGYDLRIVQFTPPGSAASVMIGTNITSASPGSVSGLHLIVPDIVAARDDLLSRGIAVSDLFHDLGGVFHRAGPKGLASGENAERKSYASDASFTDRDGNGWVLQEVTARLGADLQPDDPRFTPQLVAAAMAYTARRQDP